MNTWPSTLGFSPKANAWPIHWHLWQYSKVNSLLRRVWRTNGDSQKREMKTSTSECKMSSQAYIYIHMMYCNLSIGLYIIEYHRYMIYYIYIYAQYVSYVNAYQVVQSHALLTHASSVILFPPRNRTWTLKEHERTKRYSREKGFKRYSSIFL